MKKLSSTIILFAFLLLTLTPFTIVPNASAATVFEDSFETGSLNQWSGSRCSSGEAIGVSAYQSCIGAYSARVTSNGGGSVEYAYVYKKISASTLFVSATFYVSNSGIVEDGDRFYLMTFQAGSNTLATVGWRKVNGVVKWFLLTRNGAESIITYSDASPSLGKYYAVQLYWARNAQAGEASAEIGALGDWNIQTLYLTGDTAMYGDASEVRVGLPTVSYCSSTAVYFDCVRIANEYQDDMAYLYDLGYYQTVFSDGFEASSFKAWSQTNVYNGGAAGVVNTVKSSGMYGACFTTGSASSLSGQAYCSKNINLPLQGMSRLNDFRAAFNVASLNLPGSNGRICLFRAWSGSVEVITAGIDKTNGVLRWFVTRKNGLTSATVYSTEAPMLNEWFAFWITWCPFQYGWSDLAYECGCSMTILYTDGTRVEVNAATDNPTVYTTITKVDIGLTKTSSCRAATVYADNFEANTWEWE